MAVDQLAFLDLQRQTEQAGTQITPEQWQAIGGNLAEYGQLYGATSWYNSDGTLTDSGVASAKAGQGASGAVPMPAPPMLGQAQPNLPPPAPGGNAALEPLMGKLAGGSEAVNSALLAGLGLSGLGGGGASPEEGFYHFGSLGRVNDQLSPDVAAMLERFRVGPSQEQRVPVMNALSREAAQATGLGGLGGEELNAAVANAIGNQQAFAAGAGNIDPRLEAALNTRVAQARTAGQTSSDVANLLAQRKEQAAQGFTPAELTAMREQGEAGIDKRMQTMLRAARMENIATGRRGGVEAAALPSIAREAANAQGNLEQNLAIANIEERARRLNSYEGLLTGTEGTNFAQQQAARGALDALASNVQGTKFGQQQSALNSLSSLVTGAQGQRFNQAQTAIGSLGGFSQAQQQLDLNSLLAYQGALSGARDDVFTREAFNLGQLGQEKAGQIGLLFGAGGFGAAQEAQKSALDLGYAQLETMKEVAKLDKPETVIKIGGFPEG